MNRLDDLLGVKATNRSLGTAGGKHPSALVDGFHFNIRFILTYQLCLISLTALLTASHCWSRWRQARYRRSYDACRSSASSIQSSASEGQIKQSSSDEITPLIARDKSTSAVTVAQRLQRWLRSLLMMHPAGCKGLPGNDTSASLLLLLGLNLFYAFYRAPLSRPLIYVFADRVGLLFVANLPWLYLLSAKNQPFRLLTGASYERLNIFHRWLGMWLAVLAVLHTVGMVVVWYDFLLPRGYGVWWYLTRDIIWLGIAAFACYEFLCITSLQAFRQWWYEMFLGCHIILQSGGLLLLFFHHPRASLYVLVALAIFLLDRLLYRLTLKTRTFQATLDVFEDGQTVKLSGTWPISRQPHWRTWLRPGSLINGWAPSDHLFLTVPALSRKHKLQAHPFTIASPAPTIDDTHAYLELIMRVRDGFTKDLLKLAKLNTGVQVRLDGPYGSPHALDMLEDGDVALVLAGGSGIAVAIPMISSLLHDAQSLRQKVCLIWVVNDGRHIEWVGHETLAQLGEKGLHLIIPPPTSKAGRPDISQLIIDTVKELSSGDRNIKTALVVSGPDAMNRTARNTAAKMARQGVDIDVTVEVFDW